LLAGLQERLFGRPGPAAREAAVEAMTAYLRRETARGVPAKHISRHVLGLFQGQPGARRWRRYISQHAHLEPENGNLLLQALAHMREAEAAGDSASIQADALEWRPV
jgi:tRNA-dihydrouridine synthase A